MPVPSQGGTGCYSFTGIRPGETLFEELSRNDENMRATMHDKVMSAMLESRRRA